MPVQPSRLSTKRKQSCNVTLDDSDGADVEPVDTAGTVQAVHLSLRRAGKRRLLARAAVRTVPTSAPQVKVPVVVQPEVTTPHTAQEQTKRQTKTKTRVVRNSCLVVRFC